MGNTNLNSILPSINSFEEYETLKLNPKIFENAAKEIIHRHQLPDEPLSLFEGTKGTRVIYGQQIKKFAAATIRLQLP